jgi:uncharacterized membrane protein YhaH (DUF805 family)
MANRIGRLELLFWWLVSLFAGGIMLAVYGALTNTQIESLHYPLPWLPALVLVAVSVVILKAHISRFHDLGWPTWAIVVMFVPLVDIVALSLLFIMPGRKQANQYGEPPTFLQRFRRPA